MTNARGAEVDAATNHTTCAPISLRIREPNPAPEVRSIVATPHNHLAFLRWALAVAAAVLLAGAIAGGWYAKSWPLWDEARISFIAGELVYAHGPDNARAFGIGAFTPPPKPEWNWSLSWYFKGKELIVRCALIIPAALCGVTSAWLWIRHKSSAHRHRAVDRTKHLKRTRWFLTTLSSLFLLLATGFMCLRLDYFGRHASIAILDARATASWRHIPTAAGRGWSCEVIDTPRLFDSAWWNPSRAVLFCVHAETEGTDGVAVSLWFLATLALLPTGVLWYKRLRPTRAHQCHACQYNLVGLAPGAPCPECGTQRAISVN